MTQVEFGVICFKDVGRGHKPRTIGDHCMLERGKKCVLLSEPPEGTSPVDILTLAN